jgi:hypothetical protein
MFATTLRVEPPHFRFEKDFKFYLNSPRATSSGEFKFKKFVKVVVQDISCLINHHGQEKTARSLYNYRKICPKT